VSTVDWHNKGTTTYCPYNNIEPMSILYMLGIVDIQCISMILLTGIEPGIAWYIDPGH
jgi:hypothetical protein